MLDYEINGYIVEYHRIGSASSSTSRFDTEEDAVAFIKETRHRWDKYSLIKIQTAIIDF